MIVGYLRVSTSRQNPDNQKDEIRRFAEARMLKIDSWVTDVASGRTKGCDRKLGGLLKRMRKGDTLIVTEVSRLSRTLTDVMTIMGRCISKQIKLYTTKEKYCFDDSINSKVLCFAFGLVAEIERNLISMRTKEALAVRKAGGGGSGQEERQLHQAEVPREPQDGDNRDAGRGRIRRRGVPAFRGRPRHLREVQPFVSTGEPEDLGQEGRAPPASGAGFRQRDFFGGQEVNRHK